MSYTSARPQRRRRPSASGQAGRTPTAQPAAAGPELTTVSAPRTEIRSFAELGLAPELLRILTQQGIEAPFPIQQATLPDALSGRDVLGRGRTGSGKTLAFGLPLVQRLTESGAARQPKRPRALILVPTRELANQVHATLQPLAASLGLRTAVIFGGVGQGPQAAALRSGLDVLVACPGRLEDLLDQRLCDLGSVEITVLDEADHMADLGFLPAVRRIMDQTPARGQRLLFSATLDKGVNVLVTRYLSNPVTHSVDSEASQVSTMTHHVFEVDHGHKSAVIQELASGRGRSLLFTRTKHGARKLARQLTSSGVPAVDLHGNLAQNARERNLDAFANGSVKVLVATDIAARGIHVDDIELVIHVDPPAEHKAYLHRSGRTARAGADGVVVTVMTAAQRSDVRTLANQAGIRPTYVAVAPGSTRIVELTGPPAEYVKPAPAAAVSTSNPSRSRTGGRPIRPGPGQAGARPPVSGAPTLLVSIAPQRPRCRRASRRPVAGAPAEGVPEPPDPDRPGGEPGGRLHRPAPRRVHLRAVADAPSPACAGLGSQR